MAELEFPPYAPAYSISKRVRPNVTTTKAPSEWGYEQRRTIGQNQTAPEWEVLWILEDPDADILESFLEERAEKNENFNWTPPDYPTNIYRCDQWSRELFDLNVSNIRATFKRVYLYDTDIVYVDPGTITGGGGGGGGGGGPVVITSTEKTGFVVISMQSANLKTARKTTADFSQVTISGTATNFTRGYANQFTETSVAVNGSDANFILATVTNYVFTADQGGVTTSGTDSNLLINATPPPSTSDYFGNIIFQIYTWELDYTIDWWIS